MDYKVEIFDRFLLYFDETGFNDHQLHGVLEIEGEIVESVLHAAVMRSLDAIPILATRLVDDGGRLLWRSIDRTLWPPAFCSTDDKSFFELESVRRLDEKTGPHLRVCLLRGQKQALSVTMNHAIADGAGFRDYVYFLCDTYNKILADPDYVPATIDGDRGIGPVLARFGFWSKFVTFVSQTGESNRSGEFKLPLDASTEKRPFIARHTLDADKVRAVVGYAKSRGATLNDAVLAAYYRVLARHLDPDSLHGLEVPIMTDMRRYLPDENFGALRNLASTTATRLRQSPGESFETTLANAKAMMDRIKKKNIGLAGYLKVALLFKLCSERLASRLLKKNQRSPYICMTNIGPLDAGRLRFNGTETAGAFLCGSIKHKPHFQLALTGFKGTITLTSNLYGSTADRKTVDDFLVEVGEELSRGIAPSSA